MQPSPPLRFRPPDLRVLQEDECYGIVAHENILAILWRCTPTAEALNAVRDVVVNHARSLRTGKVAVASVLPKGKSAPSPSARNALAQLHEESPAVVHRAAVVLPDTGFVAAAIRSIVLSATQRSSRRDGHGVFSSLASALTWATEGLETPSGERVFIPALVDALEELRNRPD